MRVRGAAALFGAAFGFLISWGQFSDPDRIRAMLLLEDPYLYLMMASAIAVASSGLWLLRRNGVRATIVRKHSAGPGPDGEPTIVRRVLDGEVDLIVNTPFGSPGQSGPRLDGYEIRTAAVLRGIPCVTTVQGLAAAVQGIEAIVRGDVGVRSLQEHARRLRGGDGALG